MKKRYVWKFIGLSSLFISLAPVPASSTPQVLSISLSGVAPYYSPSDATGVAGQPIQWINSTASPHTITDLNCLGNRTCAFDSGTLRADATFSIYTLAPGVYHYFCRLHPIMRGTLTVVPLKKGTALSKPTALQIHAR